MKEKQNDSKYLRVGTTYYKLIQRPQLSGGKTKTLTKWNRETIIQDHSRKFADGIPKYDGFCCIPNHLDYQKTVENFYNIYNEIPLQPSAEQIGVEEIPHTITFLRHIFGEQIKLGLDYLKILLESPTQILPILCLVSKERSTGKSTFLKWLKEIFGLNMTYIKGDSFNSQFNSDWASMLLIAIDEVFFDRKEITERLKYLSTTNKDKLENKGKDREEIDFFGKFILCSNNEDTFIQIDENEIRFWVLKITTIKSEDTDFLERLKEEIPKFLSFLVNRKYYSERKSRMWFSPEELRTNALKKLVFKNANKLESKMLELLYEFFESNDADSINIVPQDVLNLLGRMFKQHYYSRNDVRQILKDKWKLEPQKNGLSYIRYDIDYSGNFCENGSVGRYFTISREFTLSKYVDLLS
ncbi:primase-helicase family protein [Chryseobacterium echinoideorum]|uniref:primase-helicase family protein n=1 Tax=Chryseobacterium echinoideorum TaxID=1549648 RepID=UPI001184E650|nr:primase-helicase family protein [Chryseobacterium echinoideorum]